MPDQPALVPDDEASEPAVLEGLRAGGPWRFDDAVTNVFDDMLRRSIPQYGVMRKTVNDLAQIYRKPYKEIVDLGCSRGEAVEQLVAIYGQTNHFTLVETSQPMLTAARQRFVREIDLGFVRVCELDLRREYPPVDACVTLSVLTLMFVPPEHRQRVVRDAYLHTAPGGVLVLVEKILGDTAELNATFTNRYLTMKAENGYTQEEIDRKALSLEGVLMPMTARGNEDLLRQAGFQQVDCFWRWCNFAGWLAVKDGPPA